MKRNNKKGFTLAELLIVVAIIAVLVAIAIPVFTSQLEKSREATDMANLRAAYAEASVAALEKTDGTGATAGPVTLKQTGNWEYTNGAKLGDKAFTTFPTSGDVYVHVSPAGVVTVDTSST